MRAPSLRRPSAERGFTLVELLVTLTVAAILTAVAAPSMRSLLAGRATVSASDELANSLRVARSEAMKRGLTVSVCASASPNAATPACSGGGSPPWLSGWIVFVDRNNNGTIDANDRVIKVNVPSTRLKGLSENSNLGYVSFFANGLAGTAKAQFLLTPNLPVGSGEYTAKERTVCVVVAGRVSIQPGEFVC